MTKRRLLATPWGARRAPLTGVLGLLLTATLSLAACSSDDDTAAAGEEGSSGGDGGSSETSQDQQVLDFYQCLRDHGLDVEDPQSNDGRSALGTDSEIDPNNPEHNAALEACSEDLEGGTGGGGDGENMADTESLIDFTECMRENGIDMADPGSEGMLQLPEDVDPESPEWKSALEECQEHLSGGGIGLRR